MKRSSYAYKDSGIEWLGDVPVGWDVKPLKSLIGFVNGAAFSPSDWADEGTPIVRIENLNGSDVYNCYNADVDERYFVDIGDLLFGWSGNKGTSFGPYIWKHAGKFYLNQHIFRILTRHNFVNWLYWSLKAVTAYIEEQTHGIIGMVHITKSEIGKVKVPYPPEKDHYSIASFLDRETVRLDALIQKKERMIELLKEKRIALITHAVTKGLDPNAPMKDSGIEWLGEVPEHWEVKKFEYACVLQRGFDLPSESFVEGDYPVMGSNGVIGFHNVYTTSAPNVTVGRSGSVGKVNYISTEFWAHNTSLFVLDGKNNHMKWIFYLLLSIDMESVSEGSAVPTLNRNYIHRMMMPIPPRTEQITISDQLDCFLLRIDKMIDKIETSISLLREYRASLIHHAVTGKIDLRGYDAQTQ